MKSSPGWRWRSRVGVLTAIVVALVAGGVAYATIPEPNGVLHGCYAKKGGALRLIDMGSGAACNTKKELPVDWNQASGVPGPQGPTGPTGSAGAPGATGAAGPTGPTGNGISGYEIVSTAKDWPANTAVVGGWITSCPAGKKVIGGGGTVTRSDGAAGNTYQVLQSAPHGDNAWFGFFYAYDKDYGYTCTVYAICANVS